jgi:hypothetical protein
VTSTQAVDGIELEDTIEDALKEFDLPPEEATMAQAVRELARSSFLEGAIRSDREKTMAVESVLALQDLGFSKALVPASAGGGGMSTAGIARCMSEIAYVDPSLAVAFNMHIVLVQYLSSLPLPRLETLLADVVATGATLCGGASVPTSEVDTRKAGFRCQRDGSNLIIEGKCGFASGSDAAKYALVIALLEGTPDDPEDSVVIAFPELTDSGISILNNWDAMGLRGTASHDIVCDGLVVDEEDAVVIPLSLMSALTSNAPVEITLHQHVALASLMGCWQGICDAILDNLVAFVSKRFGFTAVKLAAGNTDQYRSEESWVRHRLGQMSYMLEAGRVLLREFCRFLDESPQSSEDIRRRFAHVLYHWKLTLNEFITGAVHVGGAHGYVSGQPIERLIRDLIGCEVMAWRTDDMPRVLAGILFGEPIKLPGLAGT